MPAAVPAYLKDFADAPPGHRFSLYYAGWNDDWSKPKSGVVPMLDALKKLPGHSIKLLAALCARQNTGAEMLGDQVLALHCISTAPFATGLGNEHPLENGFAFLTPYGLPYLAGSGIKGVIRTAAEELASGEWGDVKGWNEDAIRTLFGPGEEDRTRDTHPQQGALRFWDALPILYKDEMSVEIMTPHHSEYYQGKHSPHNSENPNPISFLAVPAKSKFTFFVECNAGLLRDDTLRQTWRNLLEAAFDHAGKWLGFGAKTAVGYGAIEKLSDSEISDAKTQSEAAAKRCDWVDQTIEHLSKKNNAKPDDTLRGKGLAEAWKQISDTALKARAQADIKARWQAKDWWDRPPGKASVQAKAIYTENDAP